MYIYKSVYIQKEREHEGFFVDMHMYIYMYTCICRNLYIYSRKREREGSFVGRELRTWPHWRVLLLLLLFGCCCRNPWLFCGDRGLCGGEKKLCSTERGLFCRAWVTKVATFGWCCSNPLMQSSEPKPSKDLCIICHELSHYWLITIHMCACQ